jgi:NAD(P)-dependent dehydrogenase (short-subunit alcohol dehydrogenase family)
MVQHNKTALVTGASRGIGRATAAALARAGAHVVVHYGRSAREAESLVSENQTESGLAIAVSADRNRNTPIGRTKNLTRLSPRLRNTWRFIPHGSTQSK